MKRGNNITAKLSLTKLEEKNIRDDKTTRVSAVSSITIREGNTHFNSLSMNGFSKANSQFLHGSIIQTPHYAN